MEIIYSPSILKHNFKEIFAEGPYRIRGIEKVGKSEKLNFDAVPYIEKVHTKEYIEKIREYCFSDAFFAEIQSSKETFEAALDSVKLALLAAKRGDFAVTRPPGHHAKKEEAAGFCLFNNIAIASQNLIDEGKKVCIIDIDGHHGDGTESIFYLNSKLLYCSIHQEGAYPFNSGGAENTGMEEGKGLNINLVVPRKSGDDILLESIKFLKKYVDKFKPDVIGVSAGFDGYYEDRLLDLNYSLRGFYEVGKEISSWNYPVFSVLEGGYHEKVVECLVSFVKGINNEEFSPKIKLLLSEVQLHKILKLRFSELKRELE